MRKVLAIALTTFRESIRSKILYSVLFFAAAMVLVSAMFGTVTIGDQVRVIKDFGLMSVSLFPVAFAVIAGTALLSKELAKKTIYNILAKPVERWQFVWGKYLGMLATTAAMTLAMGAGLIMFVAIFETRIDVPMLQGFLFSIFELIIVCAAAIFFSSIVVTPLLSGLFTFGVFLAGRSAEYLLFFIKERGLSGPLASLMKALYAVLPHLDRLNLSDRLVYGETASAEYTALCGVYALGYAAVLLIVAGIIFNRREFN
jgi:ABC-type transport system involved in multi-copper enzyme maturation permease subunit